MINNGRRLKDTEYLRNYKLDETVYRKAKEKYTEMTSEQRRELKMSLSWFFLTDEIIKKTRLKIQEQMKTKDYITLILAGIGIITNICSSFIYIDFEKIIYNDPGKRNNINL